MSVIIELPSVEYTQDFINLCTVELQKREAEKAIAVDIINSNTKHRDNCQQSIDYQTTVVAEKDAHIAGLTDLINQAKEGLENA